MSPIDLYAAHHNGLVEVHQALLGSLRAVADAGETTSLEVFVPQALAAGSFLLAHHEAESTVLFPVLRRAGQLRSTDVAFLDACDRDHAALHALCDKLVAAASAPHPSVTQIRAIASETAKRLSAHVTEEEAGLAPDRFREMLSLDGLAELGREMEEFRRKLER